MGATTVSNDRPEFLDKVDSNSSKLFSTAVTTIALTASGVAGRVALQHIPSLEPLIAVAAATGFYFGAKKGVLAGASGYYLSNFLVFGGQGPWTIFQVVGAGAAGLAGGTFGKLFEGRKAFFTSAFIGVLAYEIIVNIGSLSFAAFTGIGVSYLISALPFSLTHIASTIGFGLVLYGAKEKIGLFR